MSQHTPANDAHDASDRSQVEVEADLDEQGFDAQFGTRPGAMVLCFTCRTEFTASSIDASDASRLEGESDPDDMSMVVPVTCPNCGASGTLAVQYGPGASQEEAEVVAALRRPDPTTPRAVS